MLRFDYYQANGYSFAVDYAFHRRWEENRKRFGSKAKLRSFSKVEDIEFRKDTEEDQQTEKKAGDEALFTFAQEPNEEDLSTVFPGRLIFREYYLVSKTSMIRFGRNKMFTLSVVHALLPLFF